MIVFIIMIVGCISPKAESRTDLRKPKPNNPTLTDRNVGYDKFPSPPFSLTMLDVGQGLCILVQSNNEYMVYDGGGRNQSSKVVSFFKKHKINRIKYMLASHYDDDHIAGLIGLLKTTSVDTAIIPNYKVDTKIYSSFKSALNAANSVVYAATGKKYKVGDAEFEILYATDGTEEKENNRSTVIKATYGNFSCIITGDAERETERKLVDRQLDLFCDLYVVGHHGSSSSSSFRFVYTMKPNLAFISVGRDNKYGHPTKKVLKILEKNKVIVYRTDLQGTVNLIHDGSKFNVGTTK